MYPPRLRNTHCIIACVSCNRGGSFSTAFCTGYRASPGCSHGTLMTLGGVTSTLIVLLGARPHSSMRAHLKLKVESPNTITGCWESALREGEVKLSAETQVSSLLGSPWPWLGADHMLGVDLVWTAESRSATFAVCSINGVNPKRWL